MKRFVLILALVAAPTIIRSLFRIRHLPDEMEATKLSQSWGGTS